MSFCVVAFCDCAILNPTNRIEPLCSLTLFATKNSPFGLTAALTKNSVSIKLICGLVSMGYFTKQDYTFTRMK